MLKISGPGSENWDHVKHNVVPDDRRKELILKYCERRLDSLVFLKSFLRYMYRQLLQLYNAYILVDNNLAVNIDEAAKKARYIQYHSVIARSTAESAQYIACHMYKIEDFNEMKRRRALEREKAHKKQKDKEKEQKEKENKDNGDNKDDEEKDEKKDEAKDESIEETTGTEKFFLVNYWSNADPPMVV